MEMVQCSRTKWHARNHGFSKKQVMFSLNATFLEYRVVTRKFKSTNNFYVKKAMVQNTDEKTMKQNKFWNEKIVFYDILNGNKLHHIKFDNIYANNYEYVNNSILYKHTSIPPTYWLTVIQCNNQIFERNTFVLSM